MVPALEWLRKIDAPDLSPAMGSDFLQFELLSPH